MLLGVLGGVWGGVVGSVTHKGVQGEKERTERCCKLVLKQKPLQATNLQHAAHV